MSDKTEKIYYAGEKPGKGSYLCAACPFIADLNDGDALEVCPVCGVVEYTKIAK